MNDTAQILVIQDRSGSMGPLRQATIDGFNEFVKGQRAAPGEARLRLVQFDHEYAVLFDKPLAEVEDLDNATYVPRGSTALLDAMGRGISDLGKDLAAMPEKDRPANVIVVTMTDGEENASKLYTRRQVFDMVSHQRDAYKWTFMFLGANQDAIKTGAEVGFRSVDSLTYGGSMMGTQGMYASASAKVLRHRASGAGAQSVTMNFTEQERNQAKPKEEKETKQ